MLVWTNYPSTRRPRAGAMMMSGIIRIMMRPKDVIGIRRDVNERSVRQSVVPFRQVHSRVPRRRLPPYHGFLTRVPLFDGNNRHGLETRDTKRLEASLDGTAQLSPPPRANQLGLPDPLLRARAV